LIEKHMELHGATLKAAAEAIYEFNVGLIDTLSTIVPAVKPQSAYYEMYGPDGVSVLKRTMEYAKNAGMYVIADVKRNDIGST
ncbi:MAG: orotidine 5'-phosphate decarboxylase / HUMPS family protein, partial [Clostridia bacterium]